MNKQSRKPATPGKILQEEFMIPHKLNQVQLAKMIGVERRRINQIIGGKRQVTPDTATRLARLFGTTPHFWLNLQSKTDLWFLYSDLRKQGQYLEIERIAKLAD